jgi:hypothetical protein
VQYTCRFDSVVKTNVKLQEFAFSFEYSSSVGTDFGFTMYLVHEMGADSESGWFGDSSCAEFSEDCCSFLFWRILNDVPQGHFEIQQAQHYSAILQTLQNFGTYRKLFC